MKEMMNRKNLLRVLIIGWLLFSLGYIIRDQWLRFELGKLRGAYQQGFTDSIRKILSESGKCEPINVYEGETKMALIEIDCLKQSNELEANP